MENGIQFVEPVLKTPLGPVVLRKFLNLTCDVQYNAISAIELTYPLEDSINLSLTDQSIVSVRVGFRSGDVREVEQFIIESTSDEKVIDGQRMRSLSGRSSLAFLDDAIVYPSNWPVTSPTGHEFVEMSVGTIFRTLIQRAKDRGTLLDLDETGFTGTNDSNGALWSHQHSQTYSTGTKYTQVLQEFMDRGYVDAWIDSDLNLHMVNGGTRGSHIDIGVVEFRPAKNVSEMTTATNSQESISAVLIEGEVGTAVERTDPDMATTLGRRRERYVQQGGIDSDGVLTLLADAELDLYGRIPSEETVGISNSGILPFLDFNIGDWVHVRYQSNAPAVERRVRQLGIAVSETGDITLGVTLNSILYETDVALARKIEAYTGGGGNYGSIPNTGVDLTVPNPVTSVNITSGFFIDNSGVYQGAFVANWVAPTTNVDGTAVSDISHYEVQYKYAEDTDWHFVMRTSGNETFLAYSPVTPGRTIKARVRVMDQSGHASTWAESPWTVLESDVTPPPTPSTPVSVSMPGFIQVTWDGKDLDGLLMPHDLNFVEVWQSPTPSFTPGVGGDALKIGTFSSAGTMQAPGLLVGQTVYYRLRAVDKAGNLSGLSDVDSAAKMPSDSDGEAPTETPPLTAYGLPTSIMLRSDPPAALGSTRLTYEISTDNGTTWSELPGCPTTSLVYLVEQLPDNTPLEPDTSYMFRSFASNEIGSAPYSAPVTAVLNTSGLADVIAEDVLAKFGLFGSVQVGAITIDPVTGITIPWANGVIHFPADGVSPATITAHLVAESLDVQNGASIRGTSILTGIIQIGAEISDPPAAPLAVPTWLSESSAAQRIFSGRTFRGLTRNVANTGWVFASTGDRVVRHYLDSNTSSTPDHELALPGTWNPVGGIVQTSKGLGYYLLVQSGDNSGPQWRVYRLNADLSIDDYWDLWEAIQSTYFTTGGPAAGSAQIVASQRASSQLYEFSIASWSTSNQSRVQISNYMPDPSGTLVWPLYSTYLTLPVSAGGNALSGYHMGPADLISDPNLLVNTDFSLAEGGNYPLGRYWSDFYGNIKSRTFTRVNLVPNPTPISTSGYTPGADATVTYSAGAIRVAPTSNSNADTYVSVGGDVGGMRLGMVAGKTYTVSARLNSSVHNNTFSPDAGIDRWDSIVVHHRIGSGSWTVLSSGTGFYQKSLTFTLPAGTTEAFIRLYHGGTAAPFTNPYSSWGSVSLEEGYVPTPEFFTGDFEDDSTHIYSWNGTPHNSSSTLVYGPVPAVPVMDRAGFGKVHNVGTEAVSGAVATDSPSFKVTPGQVVNLSFYAQLKSGPLSGTNPASGQVEIRYFEDSVSPSANSVPNTFLTSESGSWVNVNNTDMTTRISSNFTVPAGAKVAVARFNVRADASGERFYDTGKYMARAGSGTVAYTVDSERYVLQFTSLGYNPGDVLSYDLAGNLKDTECWKRPFNSSPAGLYWSGTNFKTLMQSLGTIVTYSDWKTALSTDFKYAHTNPDGTYHTKLSPRFTATWLRRQWMTVVSSPSPQESQSGSTDANTVRLYASPNTSGDTGPYQLQAALVQARTTTLEHPVFSGPTPSDTNNWLLVSTPGVISADVGGFWVDGNSDGDIGSAGFRDSVKLAQPICQMTRTTSHNITSGTWTKAALDTVSKRDPGDEFFTFESNGVTIKKAGWYRVDVTGDWQATAAGRRLIRIVPATTPSQAPAGATAIAMTETPATSDGYSTQSAGNVAYLNVGTHVRAEVWQNGASVLALGYCRLTVMGV